MPDAGTASVPQSLTSASAPAPTAGKRLAWLDALRGIAALCVVFDHVTQSVLQPLRVEVYHWFDPGQYGVFVFFLVSGYIVPASLERKGSIRSFWVSRVFRLYPLYIFVVGAMVVLYAAGIGSLASMPAHPATSVLADVFMLQTVLWTPDLPNVVWSLAYEMVFYLLLSALFVLGVHRRSGQYGIVFAGAAVALGGILPGGGWIGGGTFFNLLGAKGYVGTADLLIGAGILLTLAGRGRWRVAGAILAAATGMAIITFNSGYALPWEGMTILALMFTGTMLYRAERSEYPWVRARMIAIFVFGMVMVADLWHNSQPADIRTSFNSLEAAGLTFALAMLCRHRRVPSALAWLGLVSYSIYLVHPLLLEVYNAIPATRNLHDPRIEALLFAAFMAVLLAGCACTYRFIEAPMQRLGRRLARRLDDRFGPDRPPFEPDETQSGPTAEAASGPARNQVRVAAARPGQAGGTTAKPVQAPGPP